VAPIGAQLSEFASRPRKEAIERLRNGETQADIARTYGVDATTLGCVGCFFQLGRASILLPRPPHLAQTTRERNHGTSVSAGYFDTSINATWRQASLRQDATLGVIRSPRRRE
jgi:hypothetical protein